MFSFCFLTHNEGKQYISNLVTPILENMLDDEEIIIVDDFSTDESTLQYLNELKENSRVRFFQHALNKDFAQQKNFLISKCKNEYIFLMDADEYLTSEHIDRIRFFIYKNPSIDLFLLHRTNLLTGVTENTQDVVNLFKDYGIRQINATTVQVVPHCYQRRIWKNHIGIHYENKVHEEPRGQNTELNIPEFVATIIHEKSCERQQSQAIFYKEIKN